MKLLTDVENTLTETAAVIGPWLAPIPTAWLVGSATIKHLGWPLAVGIIAGLVIELFGLSATGQTLALYEYNKTKRKSDPAAPVALAFALVAGYFSVAVALTVLLDIAPALAVYAPGIFPLLSLAGVGVLALRYDHRKRLTEIENDKEERRARLRKNDKTDEKIPAPVVAHDKPLTKREWVLSYMEKENCSESTAYRAYDKLTRPVVMVGKNGNGHKAAEERPLY